MKPISIALACVLACLWVVPHHAQNKKKPTKAKAAKPAKPDHRPVAASPVIEGDPMIPEDRISIEDLKARLAAGAKILVLDVRAADGWEAAKTKIKGALRVPYEKLEEQMKGWKKTQEIVAYCA
jgi:hypothetical protein